MPLWPHSTIRPRAPFWLVLTLSIASLAAIAALHARSGAGGADESRQPGGGGRGGVFAPRSFGIHPGIVSRSALSAATLRVLALPVPSVGARLGRWRAAATARAVISRSTIHEEMSILFSEKEFRKAFPGSAGLVFPGAAGWEVRDKISGPSGPDVAGESRVDQFLATCAEVGLSASQAIEVDGAKVTIDTLLDTSRRNFVADQDASWSLVAYCLYRPDQPVWRNRFGEQQSYESAALSLMREPLDHGPCAGCHRPYALAIVLQLDRQHPCLSDVARGRAESFLRSLSRLLEQTQHRSGAWGRGWAHPEVVGSASRRPEPTSQLLLVTGHQLEWAALADAENRPSDAALAAACQFVLQAAPAAGDAKKDEIGIWSHALRALWLFDQSAP